VNQPNTRQVMFVDVTDCCGVRVSFGYSVPCVQNMKSTTTTSVSENWQAVVQLVEALRLKAEGHGFDS
jgi:hypothetical protein